MREESHEPTGATPGAPQNEIRTRVGMRRKTALSAPLRTSRGTFTIVHGFFNVRISGNAAFECSSRLSDHLCGSVMRRSRRGMGCSCSRLLSISRNGCDSPRTFQEMPRRSQPPTQSRGRRTRNWEEGGRGTRRILCDPEQALTLGHSGSPGHHSSPCAVRRGTYSVFIRGRCALPCFQRPLGIGNRATPETSRDLNESSPSTA